MRLKLFISIILSTILVPGILAQPRQRPIAQGINIARHKPKSGRSDGCSEPLTPKIFIISLFTLEATVWLKPLGLGALNVTVPGFSPLFPKVQCDKSGETCLLTTGEGEINAACTVSALVASPFFKLEHTYFFIAGIAGINPACGTLGGVAFAKYAVQIGLSYEVDAREIPSNYSSGYVPLGAKAPENYPVFLYGTEAFELNEKLRDRAFTMASKAKLNDTDQAAVYRKLYPNTPANAPPNVFKGDVETSDVFWHGAKLGDTFANYVKLLTNGSGTYCMTAQEDNASLEALVRGAVAGIVDFARIILMRTGANFDRAPPGVGELQQLLYQDQGAFLLAAQNIYIAGIEVVNDIKSNWNSVFRKGIAPDNYIGDVLVSLEGPVKADIGNPFAQEG